MGYFKTIISLLNYLMWVMSTGFIHSLIPYQITLRLMYGFALIRPQGGTRGGKTEMTETKVGSNLKCTFCLKTRAQFQGLRNGSEGSNMAF